MRRKCARTSNTYLIYLANPSGNTPETDTPSDALSDVTISLPEGVFAVHWFDPTEGLWHDKSDTTGGMQTRVAPDSGDWVLLIQRRN